ncbi:hypothetical protein HL658_18650 [Azospirillum sp. RWY-5-1]|uniref:Uncharacterized protein n=1 Tax=Azospirillum oleiclasticum TaxID=2735135 RepID=A0ABX2TM38_9PROT|nr:hypothetical protein [Azospirillum oleiclasticum]NYZ14574.1 hypothetical protein [Azospirillum oleiclasticum]NYZ24352.1 hypothetical protein [Azospirillum oleiclasticum]
MAATPFFPPVSDRGRVAATVSGVWEPIAERDFLLRLAAGLTIHTPEGINLSQVRALPDVWGQLVAFHAAWADSRHPLTSVAKAEWRGLLALIGLADWHKLPLHRVEVDLDDLITNPFIGGSEADPDLPNLAKVVDAFLPRHEREALDGWRHTSVLLLGRKIEEAQAIALIQPSTLLVPSRTYSLPREEFRISWVADGGYPLTDPVAHLDIRERQALHSYVKRLHEAVSRWQVAANSRRQPLVTMTLGRLAEFCRDLAAESSEEFETSDTLVGSPPPWHNLAPLFKVPRRNMRSGSDTRLMVRRELADGKVAGAVLYGSAIAKSLRGRELSVWGDYKLDGMALPNQEFFEEIARHAARDGLVMIDADTLLAPTLMQVHHGELATEIDTHREDWRRFILPVDPRLLAFLTTNEIHDNLTLEKTRDGYAVSLALPLQTRNNSPVTAHIRREYSRNNNTLIDVHLPASLEIWPNFKAEGWRHHYIDATDYLDQNGSVGNYARLVGVVAPREIVSSIQPDGSDNLVKALSGNLDGDTSYCKTLTVPKVGNSSRRLRLAAGAPEALSFDAGNGRRGIIALSWETPATVAGSWKVAIDFGASGTTVVVEKPGRVDAKNPQPMRWRRSILKRSLRPTGVAFDLGRLPYHELDWPNPSMLVDPSRVDAGELDDRLHVFERAVPINRHEETTLWRGFVTGSLRTEWLQFGLKYGRSIGSSVSFDEATNHYLRTILLEAAAEVVGSGGRLDNIQWLAAHPASLFRSEVDALLINLRRVVGYVESSLAPRTNVTAHLENRATTEFLVRTSGESGKRLSIVFDIGGYSTDIAIWNNGAMLWTGSLMVAGHSIFNDYFGRNPERIDDLVNGASGELNTVIQRTRGHPASIDVDRRARGIVEMQLRQDSIRTALDRIQPATVTQGGLARLKNVIRFAHAAFLDYLHLVIARLGLVEELEMGVNLFYGGRGGQLIGSFLGDSVVEADARRYLWPDGCIRSITPVFSSSPKNEVARGLLMIGHGEVPSASTFLPMGERFETNGPNGVHIGHPADAPVTGDLVASMRRRVDLTRFQTFADSFSSLFSEPATIARRVQFETTVETEFDIEIERAKLALKRAGGHAETIEAPLQPVFLLAVRTAIQRWHELP